MVSALKPRSRDSGSERSRALRSAAATALVLIIATAAGCAGDTRYNLRLDGLSFIPVAEREGEIELPPELDGEVLEFHLLPYLPPEIYDPENPPEAVLEAQRGVRVQVPFADPPEAVELRLRFESVLDLENKSGQSVSYDLEIHVAPAAATNVFDEDQGGLLLVREGGDLAPGAPKTTRLHAEVRQGEEAYDILRAGDFRSGVRLTLAPSSESSPASIGGAGTAASSSSNGASETVGYRVRRLMLEVSGRPFGFIP